MTQAAAVPVQSCVGAELPSGSLCHSISEQAEGKARVCPWLDAGARARVTPSRRQTMGSIRGWTGESGCLGWSPGCERLGLLLHLSEPRFPPL